MLENALQLALYSKENSVPLKFLKTIDGNLVDTTKAITDDIATYYMLYKQPIEDTIMIYYHENSNKDDEELSTIITLFLKSINEDILIPKYSLALMKDARRNFDQRWNIMLENTNKRLEKLTTVKEFFDGIELDEETKESLTNSFSEDNVVKSYNCEYEKFDITEENAKYVFNQFQTNRNLFYIEYIDTDNKSMIKIHDTADKELLEIEEPDTNYMYFKYKHQTDVINVKLSIKTNKIEYSYYAGKDEAEIDTIIRSIFSNFSLTNPKTLFISGTFSMDIKNYKEYNFYYFVFMLINLINKEASNIVYMRETFNPRALKKRAKYYFRDFDNMNHIDYVMSFTIDNVLSNLYNIKYRAKNREKSYILEIAYLIKKFMIFYEDNAVTTDGQYVSEFFAKNFYQKSFEYKERSYSRIPNKITNLRNKSQAEKMFPGGGEYTKSMCECKLQPIVIDKEDVKDWESYEDYNSKGRKLKHETMFFPPENSSQGPKKYYVCPTNRYHIPVLKPNVGSNSTEYPYLPCCKMTGKDDYYEFYEQTRLEGKGPVISLKQSDLQTRSLPLPLQNFFKYLTNDEVEIRPVETSINDSFLGCLLYGTKNYKPPTRQDNKNYKILYQYLESYKSDYKEGVRKFRTNINKFRVHYETAKQEMFDYTIDDIIDLLTGEEYLDSMLIFKFFEHLFCVNIFVFTLIDDKPILEKPRYKDFHVRNIIEEFPALFIYRDPTTLKGRYSLIGGKDTLFSSKMFQNLLQPYYITDIDEKGPITRLNPYQGIIWEKIFRNYKIVSQKINEDGKCYCVNIKLDKFGVSIYIPPSAPLNVPVTDSIYKTKESLLSKVFSNGERGSEGVWYTINGMRAVFIPCKDIEMNDDVCYNYVKDSLKSKKNEYYGTFKINTKNASLMIEICIWLWRVSGMNLEEWFENYVQTDSLILNVYNERYLNVEYILPKYNNVEHCLKWLLELNPQFNEVFLTDKISLYEELKDNIYLYMKKIQSLTDGLPNLPSSYIMSSLVDKDDYEISKDEFLFTDREQLMDWKNDKFHNLQVFESLDAIDVYIYRSDKGMYLIYNTQSIQETLLIDLYWKKYKKIVDSKAFTPDLLRGVTKRVGYKLMDTKLNVIKEDKKTSNVNIIFYASNVYSTFIKLI